MFNKIKQYFGFLPHKSDEYFKYKFKLPMSNEALSVVRQAHYLRYRYPDLSGPELIRLVYWGASGTKED